MRTVGWLRADGSGTHRQAPAGPKPAISARVLRVTPGPHVSESLVRHRLLLPLLGSSRRRTRTDARTADARDQATACNSNRGLLASSSGDLARFGCCT